MRNWRCGGSDGLRRGILITGLDWTGPDMKRRPNKRITNEKKGKEGW
jgi:hypothetical protein